MYLDNLFDELLRQVSSALPSIRSECESMDGFYEP